MNAQNEKEETEYILQDLLRTRSKDDIIRDVCWRTKCSWAEAESLFSKVAQENKKVIQQEKSPLRLLISIFGTAVGLIWIGSVAYRVFKTLIPWWVENGSMTGYVLPDTPWVLAGELAAALAIVILSMILTSQQLKTIRG